MQARSYSLLANEQVSLAASAFVIIYINMFNSSYIKRQKFLINRIKFGTIDFFVISFITLLYYFETHVQT